MLRILVLWFLLFAAPLRAEPLRVVADIAPVASLVAMVLGDAGEVETLVQPGASPHDFSLRPSQARALSRADGVIWIGPGLTPWMGRAIDNLAAGKPGLVLFDVAGTLHLETREIAGDGHHGHEDHDHGDDDPHAWMDPRNAQIWLGAIAEELGRLDPERAVQFAQRANAGVVSLEALEAEVRDGVHGARFAIYHDAIRYFEERFGVAARAVLSPSDASDPSARDVAGMRELLEGGDVACILADVTAKDRVLATVREGTGVKVVSVDPLGQFVKPGPELYSEVVRSVGAVLSDCR